MEHGVRPNGLLKIAGYASDGRLIHEFTSGLPFVDAAEECFKLLRRAYGGELDDPAATVFFRNPANRIVLLRCGEDEAEVG